PNGRSSDLRLTREKVGVEILCDVEPVRSHQGEIVFEFLGVHAHHLSRGVSVPGGLPGEGSRRTTGNMRSGRALPAQVRERRRGVTVGARPSRPSPATGANAPQPIGYRPQKFTGNASAPPPEM